MTNESLRDTIEPKSDQINYDDLISGPVTARITGVRRGSSEQPIDVLLEGNRPYRPCKSMRRVMIATWGERGDDWIGQSMTLYGAPEVKFGGVAVGGIRISHMTGLDKPMDFMLTTTRARRAPFRVEPLKVAKSNDSPWSYESLSTALGNCETPERLQELRDIANTIRPDLTNDKRAKLRDMIKAAGEGAG